jgi:hypothetical protein
MPRCVSSQCDLFEPPLARHSDPRSSHEAASAAVRSGTVATHEALILEAVMCARPGGMTNAEIAQRTRLTMVQVARRTRAMHRRGIIKPVIDGCCEASPLRWRI